MNFELIHAYICLNCGENIAQIFSDPYEDGDFLGYEKEALQDIKQHVKNVVKSNKLTKEAISQFSDYLDDLTAFLKEFRK